MMLLGEMVGDQLPTMVQFLTDGALGLAHGLLLEDVTVQPTNVTDAYFASATALEVIPAVTEANGGVNMHLSCLCPVPLACAPYFLDFKTPKDAYDMGRTLVGTGSSAPLP
jgi:hypothetical protein